MGVWDDLKKRLVVIYVDSMGSDKVLKPKVKDLDHFERESGFRLPDDYREFARMFGPGKFDAGWKFATPGFPNIKSYDVDLALLNHQIQSQKATGLYQNFFRFCGKEDFQGYWGWNPEDVTDPDTHDYGIYLLMGDRYDGPHKVASTFHVFVISYVFGGGFERQEEGRKKKKKGQNEKRGRNERAWRTELARTHQFRPGYLLTYRFNVARWRGCDVG